MPDDIDYQNGVFEESEEEEEFIPTDYDLKREEYLKTFTPSFSSVVRTARRRRGREPWKRYYP